MEQSSFLSEVGVYVGRVREFDRVDWAVYVAWVGLMFGLVLATGGFMVVGRGVGAPLPGVAWCPRSQVVAVATAASASARSWRRSPARNSNIRPGRRCCSRGSG